MKAMTEICVERYNAFGTRWPCFQDQGAFLETMFERYAKGQLNQTIA